MKDLLALAQRWNRTKKKKRKHHQVSPELPAKPPVVLSKTPEPKAPHVAPKQQTKDAVPWVDKYSQKYFGRAVHAERLRAALLRRKSLPRSRPVAILLRGPCGSGKSVLVKQVTAGLRWNLDVFSVSDLVSSSGYNTFLSTVKSVRLKPTVVVVDSVELLRPLSRITVLLDELHGTKSKDPQAGNALVLVADTGYVKEIRQWIYKYELATIDIEAPTERVLRQILHHVGEAEGVSFEDEETYVQNCNRNAGLMLCQAEFDGGTGRRKHRPEKKFTDLRNVIHQLRWPFNGEYPDFDAYEAATRIHGNLPEVLTLNSWDNRASIFAHNEFREHLSVMDTFRHNLGSEYESTMLKLSMHTLPIGRRPAKVSFPVAHHHTTKPQALIDAATANHMSVKQLTETLTYTSPGMFDAYTSCTVYDNIRPRHKEVSVNMLRKENNLVRKMCPR